MRFRNIIAVIRDQMPVKRFFRNFFVTRNAWGLFHKNSHIAAHSGKPKVAYNTKASAIKAAESMGRKNPEFVYRPYKCLHCDGYHVGRNKHGKA